MEDLKKQNALRICWRWYLRRWLHRLQLVPRTSSPGKTAVLRPLRQAAGGARSAALISGSAGSQQA